MKRRYTLYYCEYTYGCGLRAYRSLSQCIREETITEGTNNFRLARLATKEDVDNVCSMGGYLPPNVVMPKC